ncbi:MAG: DUF3800 domain-containing protein [Candidatus Thiodiazotropha sp.]
MFIFLDESGDLGFDFSKSGTSRYFVITLLVCHDKPTQDRFRNAVKRTLKNKLNHKKKGSRIVQELKGTGTTLAVKQYFYRHLPDQGWEIYSVTLNKNRVEEYLRSKAGKKKLYNFLARFIMEKVHFPEELQRVNLAVDRCKNSEEIKDFNRYVSNQLEALLPLNTRLDIDHLASHESAGLQAVDLFCWGFARKDDYGDLAWWRVYRSKVRFDTVYLPPK